MRAHWIMLGRYNAWANKRLYDAAAGLSDAQYREDRGAFFKSMRGTLNDLLVTDLVWMNRFTGEGESPAKLDTILHDELSGLRAAREVQDRRILAFVEGLDDVRLAGTISYRRVSTPEAFVQPLRPALAHWFNHQTHHRGQAHMILTGLGAKAPELDLLYFQREAGI